MSWICLVWASTSLFPAAVQSAREPRAPERRYDLRCECSKEETQELELVLEQAWMSFERFFAVKPEGKPDEKPRFRIGVYSSETTLREAALNEKADLIRGREPSQWSRANGNVYVLKQRDAYSTRFQVLWGAGMQFHALAKAKNDEVRDVWYGAGIANLLALHTWDGKTLELDARPLISPFDFAARALGRLDADPTWLPDVFGSSFSNPELGWSAVGLCLHAANGRYRPAFDKYVRRERGAPASGEDFLRSLGKRADVARDLRAWLVTRAQPFEATHGEWEDLGGDAIAARVKPNRAAMCASKDEIYALSATVSVPRTPATSVGFVTGVWAVDEEFTWIAFDGASARWENWRNGAVRAYDNVEFAVPKSPQCRIRFERHGSEALIHIGDTKLGPFDFASGRTGFYAAGGDATFREIEWR